jgi:glycosyltransferase involved in cell wall biosynthesis
MKTHNSPVVIHITRSASRTSMPWNDLHKFLDGSEEIDSRFIVVNSLHRSRRVNSDESGDEYIDVGIFGLFKAIWVASTEFDRRRVILHCHNASLFIPSLIVSYLLRVRVLFNIHNDWLNFSYPQIVNICVAAVLRKKLICVSRAVKDSLPKKHHIFDFNVIEYIDNSIDTRFLNSKYPLKNQSKARCKKIIIVARMVPQKNTKLLLEIIKRLDVTWTVNWFGDGPERHMVESELRLTKAKCTINIMGVVARQVVFDELSSSMLYLACSKWEGIGVANLEAAALGCIPLLSNIPAHNDISLNTGAVICDLSNLHSWLDAIEKISKDQTTNLELSKKISSATRESYGRDRMIQKYIAIYRCLPAG